MNSSAPRPKHKRVLFISNGNGEDSIAAAIIAKLPPEIKADAYPMIGAGQAFDGLCPIVGPRAQVPSQGWRHTSGGIARDIKGGLLFAILPAIKFLRAARAQYDLVIAVGDGVPVILSLLAGRKIDIYLDVFKSGYAHTYNFIERAMIGEVVGKTYCRDNMLADTLRDAGLNALSAGNVMLDTVPYGIYDMARKCSSELSVVLLPGSRDWTAESLEVQLEALRRLPSELKPDIFMAVANGIDVEKLAKDIGWEYGCTRSARQADLGRLKRNGMVVHLASGVVGNLIERCDLVLSQAGTGTQQALGLGKPVITFNRQGNRRKRMADEQALMGPSRILTPPDPKLLSDALRNLLADSTERRRLGAIGKKRLGGPGTLAAVVADITQG